MSFDPATTQFRELSKQQLAEKLRKLQFSEPEEEGIERCCDELLAHQLELEMQNRELREAQQALEESRQHYAQLYDFAPVGYCALDAKGVIREANITAANLFLVTKGELCGMPLATAARFKTPQLYYNYLSGRGKAAGGGTVDLVARLRNGAERVLELRSASVRDADGHVEGFRVAFADVTDQRLQAQRLEFLLATSDALATSLEPRETLATMAQSAVPALADVCCIDTSDGLDGSQRVKTVFTMDEGGQALHEQVSRLSSGDGAASPQAEAMKTRRSVLVETATPGSPWAAAHRTGYNALVVPLLARNQVLGAMTLIAAGGGHSYRGVNVDLAEDLARRAAQALDNARLHDLAQRAVQAREKFLALVSHDLLGLLTVVSLQTERLLAPRAPDSIAPVAKRIERATERMTLLVRDLLDFASIDAGALTLEPRREAVDAMVAEAFDTDRELANAKAVTLRHSLSPGLYAFCDRRRILQVLGNLLNNAIKFCPRLGTIVVAAWPGDGKVFISVTDSGPGVPADQVEYLFEHFWQAKKTARQGTGLGLPIVRGIVEASQGDIWVDTQVAEGASFVFTLPQPGDE